jgi:hypothetical protein
MWNSDLVIVSSHFNENLDWLEATTVPVFISTNNTGFQRTFENPLVVLDERCRAKQNHGREASAYLRFIVNYYENLPKYMAFIHGHEYGWHQRFPGTLLEAIYRAKRDQYGYISLNCNFSDHVKEDFSYWVKAKQTWPNHFETVVGSPAPPSFKQIDISAQFVVDRDRILKYSKEQWQKWLELTENPSLLPFCEFQNMPWLFEYTWHKILGEEWEFPGDVETHIKTKFNSI